MTGNRASIFEAQEEGLDLSGFSPKTGPDHTAPAQAEVRAVAEAAKFRSREAAPPAPAKPPRRRYVTGRNVHFNVKASQETIDAFVAIADRQKWVLGETLEHAVAALEQQLANRAGER
jgi:hypothetical protein